MKASRILCEISEDFEEEIAKNFGRSKKTLIEDVKIIQEWMETQPHLPEVMDTHTARNFFLMNKCSFEKTKERIDNYYTIRSIHPDLIENPKLPCIQKIMDTLYLVPLPKLVDCGRVVVYKVRDRKLIDEFDYRYFYAHLVNFVELLIKEDYNMPYTIIIDVSDISLEAVKRYSPSFTIKALDYYYKVLTLRPKKIYLVNMPPFMNIIMEFAKTVVKPSVFGKIEFLKDPNILKELIPKEVLPVDYGGEEKSLEELNGSLLLVNNLENSHKESQFLELIKQTFLEYGDWFDQRDKMKVKEDLRPEKLENDDFLGFYGNFRKLEID